MLKGYKTYIAALGLAAFAVYGLVSGHLDQTTGWAYLMQALGLAGLRSAISQL